MAEQILTMEPTSAAYQLSMAQVFAGAGKKDRALAVLSAVDAGSASAEQKNRAAELRRSLSAGS